MAEDLSTFSDDDLGILSLEDTDPLDLGKGDDVDDDYLLLVDLHLAEAETDNVDALEDVDVQETRGFGASYPSINGFPCHNSPQAIGVRTYTVPGTAVKVPVRGDVSPLLIGFLKEWNQKVEPLRPGWCWGYAARPVRGSTAPSFHWAGIAVDGNAPSHPLGKRGTFTSKQAATIRALCRKYGLRWGGDYVNRADEMHAEVIESYTDALARVKRLQTPPPGLPVHDTGSRVLREGMVGTDVRDVQNGLNMLGNKIVKDGHFRPSTTVVVRAFQKNRGMSVDGVVGKNTLARLRAEIHS